MLLKNGMRIDKSHLGDHNDLPHYNESDDVTLRYFIAYYASKVVIDPETSKLTIKPEDIHLLIPREEAIPAIGDHMTKFILGKEVGNEIRDKMTKTNVSIKTSSAQPDIPKDEIELLHEFFFKILPYINYNALKG